MEILPMFVILQRTPRVAFIMFLFTIVPALFYFLLATPNLPLSISSSQTDIAFPPHHKQSSPVTTSSTSKTRMRDDEEKCDLFTGEWVLNQEAPYYTNTTCGEIYNGQNCMMHGRPDHEFLKWRWKPDNCDLPIFDAKEFLEMVRGKSMGFVGDSLSRNQVESLLCLLSRVEVPKDISSSRETKFKVWNYTSYNFTLHNMWSAYLVNSTKSDRSDPWSKVYSLYLDEFDTTWTSQLNHLDYLIIASGHWFEARHIVFYENKKVSGCHYCFLPNTTELPYYYGYKKALRLSLRAVLDNFKGLAIFRSFSPQHFEGGSWNDGGDCVRTRPYRRNETLPEGNDLTLHEIQVEELRFAQEEGKKNKGLRLKLMDITKAMLLRPDGHPGRYSHSQNVNVLSNDCLHWCLPGPIDTWNDFLLQMMKAEKLK